MLGGQNGARWGEYGVWIKACRVYKGLGMSRELMRSRHKQITHKGHQTYPESYWSFTNSFPLLSTFGADHFKDSYEKVRCLWSRRNCHQVSVSKIVTNSRYFSPCITPGLPPSTPTTSEVKWVILRIHVTAHNRSSSYLSVTDNFYLHWTSPAM